MAYNNKQIEFIANIEAVINYDEDGKENCIYCMKEVNKKYQFGEITEKEDRQNKDLKFFILSDITPIKNVKKVLLMVCMEIKCILKPKKNAI